MSPTPANSAGQPSTARHERLWRLADLSTADLDAVPFGVVAIDLDGKILSYNRAEADFAHLDPSRVVGKNFWSQIAPCTNVQGFKGRLEDFVASRELVSTSFNYFFPFAHGNLDVNVTFVMRPDRASVLVVVERIEDANVPVVITLPKK